jgi:hypothetical protein
MRPSVRRLLWLAAAVVATLLAAKLVVTLPRFAERWISDATGLHVTMHGAGLRLTGRGFVANRIRLALDEHTPPFLEIGELDWYPGTRLLVVIDPVVRVGPAEAAAPIVGTVSRTISGRIDPGRLQVSGARIEGADRMHALPPFFVEHDGLDFERSATGWTVRSHLAPGLGRIGLAVSWEEHEGGLGWRLVADLEHVDVPALGARGATGRVVHERTASPSVDRLSGDVAFADVAFSPADGVVAGHAGLQVQGLSIDLHGRRFESDRVTVREGELILRPDLKGPILPLPAGWTAAVATVQVEQLQVRAGRLPALGVTDLTIHNVGGDSAWPVALTGHLAGGGTIEASGNVETAAGSFTGSLTLTDVELASWVTPFFPKLEVNAGLLDARLAFDGRPGMRADGSFTVRDLQARARTGPDTPSRPFLSLREAHVAGAAFTLSPWNVRAGSVRVTAPTLALQRDTTEWRPTAALDTDADALREARATLGGLAARLPVNAAPAGLDDRPATARVEARDLVVEFTDAVTQPPLTVRVADAAADGEITAAAPWSWRRMGLQGRVANAAPFELRFERDETRLTARARLGPGPLEPWSPHLARTLGHVVRAGRARLDASIDWETKVEATVGVMLDGVAAERSGGEDPIAAMLGIPLARALALLADPAGPTEFSVRIQGDASAPALGLPGAFRDMLRRTLTDAVVVPLFDAAALRTEHRAEYVRLAPLTFAAGESTLGQAALDTLDRLVALLHWETRWLVVVQGQEGAGERLPSDTVRLADERAAAVHHHLTTVRGIAEEQVEVEEPATGTPSVRLDLLPAS